MTDQLKALTSIRGLAAWWIVLFHFQPPFLNSGSFTISLISHGYLAVDLFFILSGFVISLGYTDQLSSPCSAAQLRFFRARLARIYPLHLIILFIYISVPLAISSFSHQKDLGAQFSLKYAGLSIFLLQNWGFVSNLDWNIPAWSISVELGAYLVFPAVIPTIARTASNKHQSLICLLVLHLTLITILAVTKMNSLGDRIPENGLLRCLIEFYIGSYCYQYWNSCGRQKLGNSTGIFTLGILLIFVSEIIKIKDFYLFPAGFSLIILGLSVKEMIFSRILSWSPFLFLGEISYSTYMIHYLIKDWVKFFLVKEESLLGLSVYLTITFIMSVVLFYVVENPCRRWLNPSKVRSVS